MNYLIIYLKKAHVVSNVAENKSAEAITTQITYYQIYSQTISPIHFNENEMQLSVNEK